MLQYYKKTPLEQWIENLYKHHNIVHRKQLNIIDVSSSFNLWVHFVDAGSMTIERKGVKSICIDRRLSHKQQWEKFLHEFCHIARHAGNQFNTPGHFLDMQEQEANYFQLYAAMPFEMIKQLQFPDLDYEIVEVLSNEFHVTSQLAADRLEQIKRRVISGRAEHDVKKHIECTTSSS